MVKVYTESQKKETSSIDFVAVLHANGFTKGTKSWSDYERGKRLINTLATSAKAYDLMLQSLVNFLEV